MQFLAEYGLFLAKAATIVIAILLTVGGVLALALRNKKPGKGELEITHLNKQYEDMEQALDTALLTESGMKIRHKEAKRKAKAEAKAEKKAHKARKKSESDDADTEDVRKRMFVLDFDGDIRASDVASIREEISAILTLATESDEVLVRLESGGGMVHSYGLAASQLQRIRDREIPLTVAVDKVAASGGYMMACVANTIIAAPFSIIGSIGVLAQIPNFHRVLKKNDVDFEQLHAGEYKRTLTMFGENTDKARDKMQSELEETHQHFKDFVKHCRPDLDIDSVATGEHWLGVRALELGLVDRLMTSDDYLMSARNDTDLVKLEYRERQNLAEKLQSMVTLGWRQKEKLVQDLDKPLAL
ncbi:MAG: protease SohB [Pseudomonadota bacterium]